MIRVLYIIVGALILVYLALVIAGIKIYKQTPTLEVWHKIAPLSITETYDLKDATGLYIGLRNGLLITGTAVSSVVTLVNLENVVNNESYAGYVTLGLSYLTYRSIRSSLIAPPSMMILPVEVQQLFDSLKDKDRKAIEHSLIMAHIRILNLRDEIGKSL